MAEDNTNPEQDNEQKGRRDFVRTSAAVAVTAPAVAMLLSSKTASAQTVPYDVVNKHILDDFTFGNDEEDIDAVKSGTNFNTFGNAAQDDHNVA